MTPEWPGTFAGRFALTLFIVLAVLFALALFGYLTGGWEETAKAEQASPPPSVYDRRIAEIDREAIEGAYREHNQKLYSVWMSDPSHAEAPARAGRGARNGRKAYIDAMTAVDKRSPQ